VYQSIHDGIGQGGIGNDFMPMINRQLAGNQREFKAVAVLQYFQQVVAFLFGNFYKLRDEVSSPFPFKKFYANCLCL